MFVVQARRAGIEFSLTYTPDFLNGFSNHTILVDKREVGMVISNLLSNALKFTKGSLTKSVEVEVDAQTETVIASSLIPKWWYGWCWTCLMGSAGGGVTDAYDSQVTTVQIRVKDTGIGISQVFYGIYLIYLPPLYHCYGTYVCRTNRRLCSMKLLISHLGVWWRGKMAARVLAFGVSSV